MATWRGRRWRAGALLLAALVALKPRTSFVSPRASRAQAGAALARGSSSPAEKREQALARVAGRVQKDALSGVSAEVQASGDHYAQRLEDVFMSGRDIWRAMKERGTPKKFYFIGTNGNMGDQVSESVMDSLAYIPADDGTMMLNRKHNVEYQDMTYLIWDTDDLVSKRAKISALDLYMEDEEAYRDLEHEGLKEFADREFEGYPEGCVVGESALNRQDNVDIIKQGIVIWCDAEPVTTWKATQTPMGSARGGVALKQTGMVRPPLWALAQGWEGDPDDGEARVHYDRIIDDFRKEYEKLADIRVRIDVPGIRENSYWAAERLFRALREFLGIEDTADGGAGVDDELFMKDLEKFLEGARLTKYLEPMKKWCDEQGAASLEELAENMGELADAVELKPLERKRLEKAAQVLAVAA